MIAIDTNVLLRYLLDDDKLQSKKAAALIRGSSPVLITDALIVNKAKSQALKTQEVLQGVYTFDVAARQIPGARKP